VALLEVSSDGTKRAAEEGTVSSADEELAVAETFFSMWSSDILSRWDRYL